MHELYFKKVISSIGWALLIFWGLMQGFGVVVAFLPAVLEFSGISDVAANVTYQLVYGAGYMLIFMLPVLFLSIILKKKGCAPLPIAFEARLSPTLPLLVFAAIAICFSAAQINAFMVEIFHYSEFTSDVLLGDVGQGKAYEVVLDFIVIAVVPGLCEEFFFRGAILGNLLPFGRTNAVLISSLFFAVMHQNAGQLFYTFAVGIVLGLVYERTGSIWNCTVIHILNNFLSVLEQTVYTAPYDPVTVNAVLLCIEGAVYLLGTVSAAILVMRYFLKKDLFKEGIFGKTLPAVDAYAQYPLEHGRVSRLLCTPTVIAFLALCSAQIVLLILMALMGGFV